MLRCMVPVKQASVAACSTATMLHGIRDAGSSCRGTPAPAVSRAQCQPLLTMSKSHLRMLCDEPLWACYKHAPWSLVDLCIDSHRLPGYRHQLAAQCREAASLHSSTRSQRSVVDCQLPVSPT